MKQYSFHYHAGADAVSPAYMPFVADIKQYLEQRAFVITEAEYQHLLEGIDQCIQRHIQQSEHSPVLYSEQISLIENNKSQTFPTPWGGVSHTFIDVDGVYEKDNNKKVRKYLVIRQRGVLGFEIHKEKYEHLEVIEGACLFIYSNHQDKIWKEGEVFVTLAEKGATVTLLPGDEHGLIALTNSVVQETSSYHLDDLIFLFNSQQFI